MLSMIFYAVLCLLLFHKAKIASITTVNIDFLSPESTKNLQGVAALGVILHHISQTEIISSINQIQIFRNMGFLFVGLFFFISGFGLYKSYNMKLNYLDNFIHRRILPIIICFYITNVFYFIQDYFFLRNINYSVLERFCRVAGIFLINPGSWYIPVIVIMYFSFYFTFKKIKSEKFRFVCIFIVIFLQIIFHLFVIKNVHLKNFEVWYKMNGG